MYAYIKGTIVHSTPLNVIVETGGIGYNIYIPANLFGRLPNLGHELLLYTAYVVRELSQSLYGFLTLQECTLFKVLLDISGVGPKLALSLIGHLQIQDLKQAILNRDLPTICKVPGVGKKTAERLIIELRDKLVNLMPPDPSDHSISMLADPKTQKIRDAMSALVNLGYNQTVAQKAIKKTLQECNDEVDLAILITNSLKNI